MVKKAKSVDSTIEVTDATQFQIKLLKKDEAGKSYDEPQVDIRKYVKTTKTKGEFIPTPKGIRLGVDHLDELIAGLELVRDSIPIARR
jgi:replicative DNA helicase